MYEAWDNEEWRAQPNGIKFVQAAEKFWDMNLAEWIASFYTTPEDESWEEVVSEMETYRESNPEYFYGELMGMATNYYGELFSLPIWLYWSVQKGYVYVIDLFKVFFSTYDFSTLSSWGISDANDLGDFIYSQYYSITGYTSASISNNPDLDPFTMFINDIFNNYHFVEWDYAEDGSDIYFAWIGIYYGSGNEITPSSFREKFFVQTPDQSDSRFFVASRIYGIESIISNSEYLLVATIDLSKYSVRLEGFEYPIDLTTVNKTEFNISLKNIFSASKNNTLDVYTFKDQTVGEALDNFLTSNSPIKVYIYPA